MTYLRYAAVVLLLAARVKAENSTKDACEAQSDTCELYDEAGPWSTLLQEWAVGTSSQHHGRHGRIMALPPASTAYYVTDRADGPLMPPPPPPPHHGHHPPHHGPHHGPPPHGPPPHGHPHPPPGGKPYDHEWQASPPPPPGAGKIVNRPPNPYKDQFKPSEYYQGPIHQSPPPIPVHGQNSVDRIDEHRPSPQKQVSETDLYLLGAIEKLVYRVDLMEKRLRKMEENVHYLVAGVEAKPEPCGDNFSRVGSGCYHFSSDAVNWKGASYACRKLKANMLEIDTDTERKKLTSAVLSDKRLRGGDFWTGGLNPGLLWIWSHSARPVVSNSTSAASNNGTQMATIVGEGRCLAWVHDASSVTYVYRGQDCALRHRYICEREEDKAKLSNEIDRAARQMREQHRSPKIMKHFDDADA